MSDTEREARDYITLPMRLREMHLQHAKLLSNYFDHVIDAVKTGCQPDAAALARCKGHLVEVLEESAETEYLARVRQRALLILESHRDMTAEQAVRVVECTMLDLAITPTE